MWLQVILIFLLISQDLIRAFPINTIQVNKAPKDFILPITDVYKLYDINSNSWEFQSLKSLNNRYQCLDESDNSLKESHEVITRYQFTILLNQCFHNFEQKFKSVTSQDLAIIQRLQRDFNLEFTEIKTNEISITPGFFVITNPEHNSNNNSIWIGTIRTTFQF